MLLRTFFRPIIIHRNRKELLRFSSSVAEATSSESTESSTDESDLPVRMENPFRKERVQCVLCKHQISPDYKNVKLLSQFQSPFTGRIYGRHITGLCKKMQRKVEQEIVKAQKSVLMGTVTKDVQFFKDPKLFDPERPIRPHKY
ncbi:CLUMA_CG021223, isoform A [Clunio marinus]|uniref:CLUMA_CG021223, isoform A n=1 Tax=Clunio marinus TaxID=568069 RepID=A0A1J1J887_9DIPT|nr:CLUMA_CG021223, isoform A [Clunio marinus]